MPVTRLADEIGRVVGGRYRLVAPLGAGASAAVYLADDTHRGERVALKLLHPSLADEATFLKRFAHEARAAAALDHPNIVALHDWGDDDGVPYLVTEYLAGGSLRSVLDSTRLSPSQGLLVGLEASRALDHAHRRGIVHRDVKPANLLLGDDHHLRIADFGLARALAEAAVTEPTGALLGTARYASPEQAQGRSVDGRSDVYSLALVLVEAITGRVPFASDTTIATLMARVDAVPDLDDAVGPLRRSLERALAPDPDDRPDAGELGISLMAVAEELDRPEPLPLAPPALVVPEGADADATGHRPLPTATPVGFEPGDETAAVAERDGRNEQERGRRRWPVLVAGIVLALALGAAAAFAFVQARVPSHEVPDLAGMSEIDARAAVDEFGWRIEVREDRALDTEPGEVIRTDPEAGSDLSEGETLLLVVSRGNPLARLPDDLIGAEVDDAVAALDDAGFGAAIEERFDEDVAEGVVLALAPGQEVEAPLGSDVPLIVSAGPEPRVVPDGLVGGTFDEAATALEDLGLVAERVDVFSDEVPVGEVVALAPESGEEVARDSTVEVRVSKGPDLVVVPEVEGLTLDQAVAALEAAGLSPGDVFGPAKGSPESTDPEAGTEVRRGSSVDIYLKR